jgi:ATP/maltotriose-dependent transcriptional regulator MalT/DNA-binding SARP family transcriptional activator
MTGPYGPPHIADAIRRPRLFNLLDQYAHRQNFFITGQAAQGKSTLVASYLKESGKKILWYHLCPDDNDDAKLFDRLASGIRYLSGAGPGDTGEFLPVTTLGAEKGLLRYIEGLTLTFKDLPFPLIVVLDDAESLDESSAGFEMINALLNTRFYRHKFFILSRTILPFRLPRLKTEHHGFFLKNEDLSFTLDETEAFFQGKYGGKALDIERIHKITDGWAGGLILVSESLRRSGGVSTLPERVSSEAFDYFSREIYKTLSEPIREFLRITAVPDIIDLDMVAHISEPIDGLAVLTGLEKRNLFIQRMEIPGLGSRFKYHNLFRDFLLQDLRRTLPPEEVNALYHKAGRISWEKKDPEAALNYFMKAGAFPDMIRILRIKGADYMIQGKMSGLERWISCLPDQLVGDDPWLIFFLTMTRRIRGGKKNIRDFQRALTLFEEMGDIRGILLALGYLIEAAVFIREPSSVILKWIQKAEGCLEAMPEKERFTWARGLLWQQMGLGYIAGDGNIPKGVSACRNAVLLGTKINNPDLVLHASITMAFGHVQAGDFARARQLLIKIRGMTSEGRHPEFRALKNIVDIDFALKSGRFDDAGALLVKSEQDIEKFGLIFLYPSLVEAGALYRVYTGRFDEAFQMADHLNDFSILEGNDFYKGIAHRVKALSFFKQGQSERAARQIDQALKALDQLRKGDIHHFLTQQLAGAIYFEAGDSLKAESFLKPSLEYFERISSDLNCAENHLISGLVAWERKDRPKALGSIRRGLEIACREGYGFFPLVSGRLLVRAVVIAMALEGNFPGESLMPGLNLKEDPSRVMDEMGEILAWLRPGERDRALENLRPLYKYLLPPIRIDTLGQFNILCGHKVLDSKIFEGARPLLLLKSIVLHGSRDIPKEILMDDLWPEADTTAGEKNFKINLHRLRKAMEPEVKKEFGYSYIIQKAGLVSLDPALVTLDVEEFLTLSMQAAEKEKNNELDKALELYDSAAELYKGDYFAEEPYLEWILRKRDLLRTKYIEVLERKARLHEELDQIQKAVETWQHILDMEPYSETAYQNLMILYADSGQKNKAREVFEECLLVFKNELGIEPDKEIFNIYDKIKSR